MAHKKEYMTLPAHDPLSVALSRAASELIRFRALRDAMDMDVTSCRDLLNRQIPDMREYLPPDDRTMYAIHKDGRRFKLTVQRTGGQPRISKTKLLEHGISPDTIDACTEYSSQGETVVVKEEPTNERDNR